MKKLAMFFLLVLTVAAYAEDKWTEQIKILMTEQEKADYKKLKSDADKEKFVVEFWAKRDPSPGTPENEYKSRFETNFGEVNARMKDKRAFETDMGQTLLLLGPPSDQKQQEGKEPGYGDEEDQATPGKQVWVYKNLPAEVGSGEVKLEFKATGGEWRFADKKLAQALLEKARQRTITAAQASAQSPQEAPQQQVAPPAGAQGPPPVTSLDVKAALDATASGSAPQDVSMNGIVDSFMTSTGDVFSTFAVNSNGAAAGAKIGIRVIDAAGKTVAETELPFVDATANPPESAGYFQSNLPIAPGEYSIAMAVSSDGKAGGVKKTLSVPNYIGKFAMSSIILSKGHTALTEAKLEKTPYTFGKIKVDPNVNRTFTKTDDLIIVYEVYNFLPVEFKSRQPAAGKPSDISDQDFQTARSTCESRWPEDFAMRAFCEEQQFEAIRKLGRADQSPVLTADVDVTISFTDPKGKVTRIPPTRANGLVTGKKMTVPTSFALSEKIFTPGQWKILVQSDG